MLKTRLLTGLLAGFLVLGSLFLLNTQGVGIVFGVVTAIAAFEWAALSGLRVPASLFFALLVAMLGVASLWVPVVLVSVVALLWWAWAIFEVFVFRSQVSPLWHYGVARLVSGAFVLVPAWRGCVWLKAQNPGYPWLLIWVLAMVWTADSVAYFVGRAYGKHKLAPLVSPGKSLEGAAGGLAGAAFVGALGADLSRLGVEGAGVGVVFGVLVAVLSVVGDLLESKAKRLAGVKDSGRWLPGHGGILDRIDALTAAVPLFVLGVRWLGVR